MKKLVIVALLASGLALSACDTVRGVGDDLKSVADKVDKET